MALIKCTECGGTISDTATVCPHCGAPIMKCKECGAMLPAGATTCPSCGAPADAVFEKEEKEQPTVKPQRRGGNGLKIALIIVAAFVLFLVITCPGERKHKQVVEDLVSEAVEEMGDSTEENSAWSGISDMIVSQVTKTLLGSQFSVDNYLICSVGKVHYHHENVVVTFGIANHVFCLVSKEDIKENIRKWEKEKKDSVSDFFSIIKNIFGSSSDDGSSDNTESQGNTGNVPDNTLTTDPSDRNATEGNAEGLDDGTTQDDGTSSEDANE